MSGETTELSPAELEEIHEVLGYYLFRKFPDAQVWLFGSRATGRNHPRSDIDLAIDAGTILPRLTMRKLADAFTLSSLPQTVDLVDIQRLDDDVFRQNLLRERVPLPAPREPIG